MAAAEALAAGKLDAAGASRTLWALTTLRQPISEAALTAAAATLDGRQG